MHRLPWFIFYETCTYLFVGSLVFLISVAFDQEIENTKQPFYTTVINYITSGLSL